ncbi:MAG: LamG-like jellyroll fold domain-containing protein [Myxococcota bacterium]
MTGKANAGFALVPVVLMLALIGSIAFVIGEESRMTARSTNQNFELRQASYSAEAGYHHARWQLQKSFACSGYSTLTGTIAGSAYTTTVSPDNGSPVDLASTSSSQADSTRVIEGTITTFSGINTLVLQPGAAGKDALIWDGAHSDENFGATDVLRLDNTGREQAILIQFDLSGIESGAVLRKANLELYAYSGSGDQTGEVDAHTLTRAWVEGVEDDERPSAGAGVTYDQYDGDQDWDNAGGDYQATPSATTTIPDGTPAWFSWEITDAVQAWTSGALANHGILLRVSSGDINKREFASGDAADSTLHPKLTIEYACACGTPCSAALIVTDSVVLSTDGDSAIGGVDFAATDLMEYNPGGGSAAIRWDGRTAGLSSPVDALHVLSDGTFVLSTQEDESLGDLSFSRDDLIRYDPTTNQATTYFKSRLHFTAGTGSVDAVFVRPSGNIILSTAGAATLAGVDLQDNDFVEYDPRTQTASLFFDGDGEGLSVRPSALHVLGNGHLLFATKQPTSFAGRALLPDDLVEYDPVSGSASLYLDGTSAFERDETEIQSLHVLDGQNAATPLDPRLVAHWKLDETSGTTAQDSSGDHDGELDAPDWAAGQVDGAADFDGNRDAIKVRHADTLSLGGEFTLSTWFRAENISSLDAYRILSKETSGKNDNYFLALQGDALYLGVGGEFFSPGTKFLEETWYHVAATFSDLDNEVRLYVNGSLVLSTATFAELTPNSDELVIGNNWEESKPFDGLLDEIRIYNYALADYEIASLGSDTELAGGGSESLGGGNSLLDSEDNTGTYRDEFREDESYAGSDGTLDWDTPWIEINESDGASRGDELISDDFDKYELRIADNDGGGGEGVYRAVDLSKCAASLFTFDYRRSSFDRSSDSVTVSVSDDGGESWKAIQVIEGPGDDDSLISAKHDLAGYLSEKTRIRFLTSDSLGNKDYLYIDNVEISCQ